MLVYLLAAAIAITRVNSEVVSVNTGIGELRGIVEDVDAYGEVVRVRKFMGIPYAEPPVGDLRFRKPVPKKQLDGPLNVSSSNIACFQHLLGLSLGGAEFSEDCLLLNVYAPEVVDSAEKLPVMIWIHGGAFVGGTAHLYNGDILAGFSKVIVVTINYRLSLWGFLSSGDEHSPGNYGLWDQHMAIKWVHENIEAFGGNPSNITLFGESAGATSVLLQALFPGNRGLIQRTIAQSGSVSATWASTTKFKQELTRLSDIVNCTGRTNKDTVDCLRRTPNEVLDTTLNDPNNGFILSLPLPFIPVYDGEFIVHSPRNLSRYAESDDDASEFFSSTELMIGVNAKEAILWLNPLNGVMEDPNEFLPTKPFFEDNLVKLMVRNEFGDGAPEILSTLIAHEYTYWDNPEKHEAIREEFIDMYTDFNYVAPMYEILNLHASISSTQAYMYVIDANPSMHYMPTPSWFKGTGHLDELIYLFPNSTAGDGSLLQPSEQDIMISKDIMNLWTNFAKNGNPNSAQTPGVNWQPYNFLDRHYLRISANSKPMQRFNLREEQLWNTVLPRVLQSQQRGDNQNTTGAASCTSVGHVFMYIVPAILLTLFKPFY